MANTNSYIGKQIGTYRVIEELGSGSFGSVYKGIHIFIANRTGAIKLMHNTHLDSTQERDSFLQEARFLEMLKHPHILPILDVGIQDGFPYLVTEFAPNGSLRDRMKRQYPRLLPMAEVVSILSQVGQALHYAHQQQIIHRDLKPANILFNAQNQALLADFGIATTLASASIKFVEASGSPPYMAPEQFQGTISKESDQYALGCIAYELFTGHRPFTAPDPFTMGFKHLTERPIALRELNPSILIHIEQAVLKAIAKERTDRFVDVLAFVRALEASPIPQADIPTILSNAPPSADTDTPTEKNLRRRIEDEDTIRDLNKTVEPTAPAQPTPVLPLAGWNIPSPSTGTTIPPFPAGNTPFPPFGENTPVPAFAGNTPPPSTIGDLPTLSSAQEIPTLSANNNAILPAQYTPGPAAPPFMIPAALAAQQTGQQVPAGVGTLGPSGTISPPPVSRRKRRRRWPLLVALIFVLLLVLIPGSVAAFYTFAYPAVATVTITPLHQDLQNSFPISVVTGKPEPSKHQVAGARLLSAKSSQNQLANATGIAHTSATQAFGQLTVVNNSSSDGQTVPGSTIKSKSGITVVLRDAVVIPAHQSRSVASYTQEAGARSNIPPNDVNATESFADGTVTFYNAQAFTGGKDAGTYTTVQQADIDKVAKPLAATVKLTTSKMLQGEVQPNEQLFGTPQCTSNTTHDKNVGDAATTFNVNVSATCTGEAYDPGAAKALAADLLKQQASSNLDPSYILSGTIATVVAQVSLVDAKKGTLSLSIAAEGIWDFHFSDAQKQTLTKLISGKSRQDAQASLSRQNGVSSAQVTITGDFWIWNAVPTNLANIKIMIKDVSVRQPTPTPTSAPTSASPTP